MGTTGRRQVLGSVAMLLLHTSTKALEAPTERALDDLACSFDSSAQTCVPVGDCIFQFTFGDLSLNQSCRVNKERVASVPQQIHLAFAGEPAGSGMVVSWATYDRAHDAQIWLGTGPDDLKVLDPTAGAEDDAITVGLETEVYYADKVYSLFTYHATISGLSSGATYYYKVGSASGETSSSISSFITARAPEDEDASFRMLVYEDFGIGSNAQPTISYLNTLMESPSDVELVYHIGDISYADNAWLSPSFSAGFFYEATYNRWMNALTPVMRSLPYMVLVGNHEAECHSPSCFFSQSKTDQLGNYSAFNARFRMPAKESGGAKNMWYSFEHGPVHFTSISSETDYENAPENSFIHGAGYNGHFGDQLAWLEQDLRTADVNRERVPWLVVGMHRAMYTLLHCDDQGQPTDQPKALQSAFEELFLKYKVDVVLAGHVHAYERHFPIARGQKVVQGVSGDASVYASPQAPVYVVTGAAGSTEGHDESPTAANWNANRDTAHYGISSISVNRTALAFEFIGTEAPNTGKVFDSFVITKI